MVDVDHRRFHQLRLTDGLAWPGGERGSPRLAAWDSSGGSYSFTKGSPG